MRIMFLSAILAAATITAAPGFAQAPVTPQQQLATLMRQDASLRDRIGRIQLDALVARVDGAIGHRPHLDAHAERPSALQHDLDLYTY